MASKTDSRARLHRASDQQTLVRVSRDLKFADRLTVFILEVGERWVLAQSVEDGGYADGYIAFRLKDVRKVERDQSFAPEAARILGQWPPVLPARPIALDGAAGVLQGMARNAPILAIEREADRSGLWIGAVHEVDEKRIWLTELDTRARWKDRPLGYRLRAITSVSIDSRYLRALLAVAKPPRASATTEPEADGAELAVGHA